MSTTAKKRYSEVKAKARNDAYTGLLAISLLAMLISCVLLYLDYSQYGTQKPTMPRVERSLPPPSAIPPAGEPQPPAGPMGNVHPHPMGGPG
jgi:hypothetical protein